MTVNLTKITESFIDGHPSIRDCVRKKLVNYSALSRQILKSSGLPQEHFDAVLIAARRYYRKVARQSAAEDDIVSLLSRSRVEVKTKVAVVVVEQLGYGDDFLAIEKKARKRRDVFYAIEGSEAITVVVAMDLLQDVRQYFRSGIIRVWENVALVAIRSAAGKQDTTPGFLAFISSKLGQQGINILEFMSCWSETLLVVEESDVPRVLEAVRQ